MQWKEVIDVLDLENNLTSMVQLNKKGLGMKIEHGCMDLYDNTNVLFKSINNRNDAYIVKCDGFMVCKETFWRRTSTIDECNEDKETL